MAFQVRTEGLGRVGTLDPTVYILEGDNARAEVWPAQGFNCYRFSARNGALNVIYADPQFLEGSSPTRTGIPILFPFPNRIRDGRFTWDGKEYHLPQNDPAKKNAIHGFACRRPWRVVDQGADANSAWVTGEFQGSRDAADCSSLWPADYRLRITHRLSAGRLRIEATVDNPDARPLPFGLGYHPYFQVDDETSSVQVPAQSRWDLKGCLPSGRIEPVDAWRDLNLLRRIKGLMLDDVLTGLPSVASPEGLCQRGTVDRKESQIHVWASPAFREAVVFTPPHRQAFCIEPYTCMTDAINLQQRGMDAGWLVLPPGQSWTGIVAITL